MSAHWKYLKYVLRHKFWVFYYGCQLGIPFTALMHDNSKFSPSEWFAYVDFFYGKSAKQRRDATGYYKPVDTGHSAFDRAWFHHQANNKHHWEWWCIPHPDGTFKPQPIPDRYRKEMLADWRGAGRAQGTPDTVRWYRANKDKLHLHPDTRAWVEQEIEWLEAEAIGAVEVVGR